MTELETTVAAPFRHTRMSALSQIKIIYYYTQDKKWMSLEQSKKLIKTAERAGLLSKNEGGEYVLSEKLADVKIPTGFRPTDDIFTNVPEENQCDDPVECIINEISSKTGKDKKEIVREMHEIKTHFNDLIGTDAACVMVAKKYNVDITAFMNSVFANSAGHDLLG